MALSGASPKCKEFCRKEGRHGGTQWCITNMYGALKEGRVALGGASPTCKEL